MSAIDDVINHGLDEVFEACQESVIKQARAELASLRAAVAERDKWRAWKPNDEDLSALQAQAKSHDGTYTASLAACVAYIGALEARLRERDAAIARMHKALIDVIEHQSELNNSRGRPISHSKTIALALAGLNEDEAAAMRARGRKGAK